MLLPNTCHSIIGDKHSGSQDWQKFPRAADVRLITCAFLSACERPYEFRCFSYLSFNQQSEYNVFHKLMCCLAGCLTCGLPNVVMSPPARSHNFSHYWLMFGSSFTRLYNTQRSTTGGRTPLDEWSARRRDLYLTTQNTTDIQAPSGMNPRSQQASGRKLTP